MKQAPINIKNKRATFDYELTDTYTAGIVLTGTEINPSVWVRQALWKHSATLPTASCG